MGKAPEGTGEQAMMNVFTIWLLMVSQMYTNEKTFQSVHYKYVSFIACQFYLNKGV